MRQRWGWLLPAVLMAGMNAWAQDVIAIRGARLLTVTRGVIENGTLLIENGKISALGKDARIPSGAKVIDGQGKVVAPGMIDAGNRLGLVEIPAEEITVDATEYTEPIQPDLRVLDALNTRSALIRVARAAGITNALATPAAGNLIAGQSAFINLDGETAEEMVVKAPAALHVNLGEASKLTYGPKGKSPDTRMGQMALLRQAFLKAQHYRAEQAAYVRSQKEKKAGDPAPQTDEAQANSPPLRDLRMEALLAALDGRIPVIVKAHRVGDIEMALRFAGEFSLKLVLSHATSAWRMADALAARQIPVILGPIQQEAARLELLDARLDAAALLHRAGVPLAFLTDGDTDVRDLPFAIQYAIGHGLPDEAALAAVTINPARFLGVDDRLGSLEVGKQANLIVLDGLPFYTKTRVVTEIINGKIVDLTNHQTQLYEFYRKKYGVQ